MKLKPEMKVYKIRDTVTGLFSMGGMSPWFNKEGKTWTSRGALKSHLTLLKDGFWLRNGDTSLMKDGIMKAIPTSWEIVEYVLKLENTFAFSALEEAERVAKK